MEPAGGAQFRHEIPEAIGTQTEEKSCRFSCNQPDASSSGSINVTAGHNGKAEQADIQRHSTTFNDIPQQITPEGNVLRVAGGQSRIDVER